MWQVPTLNSPASTLLVRWFYFQLTAFYYYYYYYTISNNISNIVGSVPTFRTIWRQVSSNLEKYKNLPRILGECGGKNFHFAHSSADIDTLVAQTTRSAFEFSGQKCSACERLYVPDTIWPKVKEGMSFVFLPFPLLTMTITISQKYLANATQVSTLF